MAIVSKFCKGKVTSEEKIMCVASFHEMIEFVINIMGKDVKPMIKGEMAKLYSGRAPYHNKRFCDGM